MEKEEKKFIVIAIIVLVFIVGLWLSTWLILKDDSNRGTFGDMFGAVNALFSGLALAGIILTILLQRKELSLQRQELQETREELKRSADAQERSEKALNRQAENLKVSAKLTALNTLVNYYKEQEQLLLGGDIGQLMSRRKQECLQRIEEILEQKENT